MNRAMPNKEQIPRSGTKMQQKPMPKQDMGGGIIPPPRRLREGIKRLRRGGNLPPRRFVGFPSPARLQQAGNPLAYRSNYPVK